MTLSGTQPPIPIYSLYGETGAWSTPELMHCESIATRSALHNWEIRPHRHEDLLQILFLKSGAVRLTLDERQRQDSGPLLIVIPPRVVHGFTFSPDVAGYVITQPVFALKRLSALSAEACPETDVAQVIGFEPHPEAVEEIDMITGAIAREFASPRIGRLQALESLLNLLHIAVRRCGKAHTARPLKRLQMPHRHVTRFYELVEDSYSEGRPVEWYAAQLGITPEQLNRSLRRIVKKSALGVIHERVILEAKRNLTYTSLTVAEISSLLGFSDSAYFSRFFSRHTGQPPGRFRRFALSPRKLPPS